MRPPRIAARLRPQLLGHASIYGASLRPLSSAGAAAAASSSRSVGCRAAEPPFVSAGFFLSNWLFQRSGCLDSLVARHRTRATSTSAAKSTAAPPPMPARAGAELPPHRRRQARKLAVAGHDALLTNASSALASVAAAHPDRSGRRLLSALLSLSKPRLTVLVILTAMAPYALYPMPEMLTPSMTDTPSLSPLTLLFLTTGTTLCSASANALNMLYEPSTDAKMSRTRNRPLVRRLVSVRSAALFTILAGAAGVGALYFGVNPTVSLLGLSNIVLYAGVYTPLKAVTAFNTWIGAVVGGIPPLMGWAAAAGEAATKDGSWRELLFASDGSSVGGWLLAGLLFAWQFPHFMALSWPIRDEYRAAGLRMLAWANPARNARVALRYSLVFVPICLSLCAVGVTDWSFAATSLPVNLWLAREAVRFWRFEGHGGSARSLFWASVWHLPAVMILALLHKKGIWARAWASVFGETAADGLWVDEGEAEELQEMASMTAARVAEKTARPGQAR